MGSRDEFVRKLSDGTTRIRTKIGEAVARSGLERKLLPAVEVNLKGWHRAHSVGARLGAERAEGILYAPPKVNLELQNQGIEKFIKDIFDNKRADVDVYLTVETRAHPGTLRLAEVQYKVEIVEAGKPAANAVFEASIEVQNKTSNPRVTIEATSRTDLDNYLKPVERTTRQLAGIRGTAKSNRGISGKDIENRLGGETKAPVESERPVGKSPQTTNDGIRGEVDKLAEESSAGAAIGRTIGVRAGRIAGRLLKQALGPALIFLDAKDRAEKEVSRLRQDLAERMNEVWEKIEEQKQVQLENKENLRLFEIAPFDQYWFRIQVVLQLDTNQSPFRYIGIEVKDVSIVKSFTKEGFGQPKQTEIRGISEQEYVEYQPVFEELTRGQKLAADGFPLRVIDGSHDGPTGAQRTRIIYDYITFAKQYPQLRDQYKKAWREYKFELCVAGYTDLFTPRQIENCKDLKSPYELTEEARETDDWRLRPPSDLARGIRNQYINRKP